jgi:basic membrane protein A
VRRPLHLIALLLLVGASLVVASCGSDDNTSSSTPSGAATTAAPAATTPAAKKIKVGLVTDIGGLNDRSFNQLANAGLEQSEKDLGIQGRVLPSKSNADYIPNLSSLAQQKYDLVIGVGFLMADAMDTVASKFPDTKFAIIDVDATTLKHKPTNVTGLLFKEQEAGYLAGYMAGLYMKDAGGDTISSVGGQKIPPVDHYIAGYQAGAKAADPGIKTLNAYSQDFVDQAKCKEAALNQIQQGSKVVFQVAGQCGLGAIDAAKEKGVQAIGVDADQAYLGPQILTSAEKKVDVAVETAIKAAQDGSIAGGTNTTFDLKNDGVGIGKTNTAGAKYADQVKAIADQIVSGQISDIPDTVAGS